MFTLDQFRDLVGAKATPATSQTRVKYHRGRGHLKSESTIRQRLKDGTLPATKFGGVWRVRRADLERLFPSHHRRPTRGK